jgi:uncharacterized protein YbcV (DUF1398 family)
MDAQKTAIAEKCIAGAYGNTLNFPQAVGILMEAGFEGYLVDYRGHTRTHYLMGNETLVLPTPAEGVPVAEKFDGAAVSAAIAWAQSGAADYTYAAFNRQVMAAGCAGYLVSFSGRRVVYFGRTGELHVEHFPD